VRIKLKMNKYIILLICIMLLSPVLNAENFFGKVVRVIDGDTVTVLNGRKQEKIRLGNIDAPEKSQAFGNQSKKYLSVLIFGKNVEVKFRSKDRYGRIIGVIYLDGRNINLEMVKAGYAWWYKYYAKNKTEYKNAEYNARNNKSGLWQDSNPTAPWEYRRNK